MSNPWVADLLWEAIYRGPSQAVGTSTPNVPDYDAATRVEMAILAGWKVESAEDGLIELSYNTHKGLFRWTFRRQDMEVP